MTYWQALGQGIRHWGRLFTTRFFAGVIVLFGMAALIVPGIILAVRYFLIDYVVVLEGVGGEAALRRSAELTKGRRWPIFWAAALFMVGFCVFGGGLAFVQELCGLSYSFGANVAVECIGDVIFGILTVVGLLYFVEAREERSVEEPAAASVPARPVVSQTGVAAGWVRCDTDGCGQLNPPEARFCSRCGRRF